jgi:hypothetical protein
MVTSTNISSQPSKSSNNKSLSKDKWPCELNKCISFLRFIYSSSILFFLTRFSLQIIFQLVIVKNWTTEVIKWSLKSEGVGACCCLLVLVLTAELLSWRLEFYVMLDYLLLTWSFEFETTKYLCVVL